MKTLKTKNKFTLTYHLYNKQYLCRQIIQKLNLTMEVISIERSTYEVIDLVASLVEELLTSFNSFVSQMMAMGSRGTDKRLGEWLDNQDVCQILNISPRTFLHWQASPIVAERQTLRQNGTLAYSQIEHKIYYKLEDVEHIIPLIVVGKKNAFSHKCFHQKGGRI